MSKLVLYSSIASQWANVPLLGLAEKQYQPSEYEVKEVDITTAENLNLDYVAINKNATVPALKAPGLASTLIDSTEILEYLDRSRPQTSTSLAPSTKDVERVMLKVIDLVHSSDLDTSVIYWGARDESEMKKIRSVYTDYYNKRQVRLQENRARFPLDRVFWGPRVSENGKMLRLCTTPVGQEHHEYMKVTEARYDKFILGLGELEETLVLPWAAGEQITYADLHLAPWVSHALYYAGAKSIDDVDSLETWVAKSQNDFRIGPKIREWWRNMQTRESFRQVFPVLR